MNAVEALPRHFEISRILSAPPGEVFRYLDDHARLSAHMEKSSWMMAGSRMTIETDAARGQAVGSVIRLRGRVLGIRLSVEEVVCVREAPHEKTWETVGTPRLLVIGHYRMGFSIDAHARESLLRVFIDYALPPSWPARWLGRLFGGFYARWCTTQMADDAARHFQQSPSQPVAA